LILNNDNNDENNTVSFAKAVASRKNNASQIKSGINFNFFS